jgi:hypothetical protein
MAGFIQIIEYQTSRPDEIRDLGNRRRDEMPKDTAPSRISFCADRDRPGWYRTIVEFESYERAMANSARPETSAFAEEMSKLLDGPPTFTNLDLLQQDTV